MSSRILIVDDALIMRQRIREIAEETGWEVVGEASNGIEAITLCRKTAPDLVTLDIVMPEMDGVATLRQLRADQPATRVVMVSAVNQKSKLNECIELGAVDFIVKPFERARLTSLFEKYRATGSSETESKTVDGRTDQNISGG